MHKWLHRRQTIKLCLSGSEASQFRSPGRQIRPQVTSGDLSSGDSSPEITSGHHSSRQVTTRHLRSPQAISRSPSTSTTFSCSLTVSPVSVPASGGASGGVPGSGHGRPVALLPPFETVASVLHLLDGRPRRLVRPADTTAESGGVSDQLYSRPNSHTKPSDNYYML